MTYSEILCDVSDRIATITLHRPDKLNAWTMTMDAEFRQAVTAAEQDPDVRVIMITGSGRGFCAGADMALLQTRPIWTSFNRSRFSKSCLSRSSRPSTARRWAWG